LSAGGEVAGKRQTRGLRHVHARADQQKGECRADLACRRAGLTLAGENKQREGHDREAAELQQRAHPDEGHAAPAEMGTIRIGAVADQRAKRRDDDRQRDHEADQCSADVELDDHDPVERSCQEHHRHADGNLEQREPHEPTQRQVVADRIRKRQESLADMEPERCQTGDGAGAGSHRRTSSIICEV
jgi:hypothetical protein